MYEQLILNGCKYNFKKPSKEGFFDLENYFLKLFKKLPNKQFFFQLQQYLYEKKYEFPKIPK